MSSELQGLKVPGRLGSLSVWQTAIVLFIIIWKKKFYISKNWNIEFNFFQAHTGFNCKQRSQGHVDRKFMLILCGICELIIHPLNKLDTTKGSYLYIKNTGSHSLLIFSTWKMWPIPIVLNFFSSHTSATEIYCIEKLDIPTANEAHYYFINCRMTFQGCAPLW